MIFIGASFLASYHDFITAICTPFGQCSHTRLDTHSSYKGRLDSFESLQKHLLLLENTLTWGEPCHLKV